MKTTLRVLTVAISSIAAAALQGAESWWPQFRGPNCSGVSETAKPPAEFGPGNNQLWKVAVPSGASSPCVWSDHIFLTAFDHGKLETHCYNRTNGKLFWKRAADVKQLEEFHSTEGSPAASTCTTDGRTVVSYFGSCGLVAYDFNGKELWQHKLPVAQTAGGFGTGGSPVIEGGLVILDRDQITGSSLLAIDLRTGKQAWETQRPDVSPGFGTPIVWKRGKTVEVVMSGSLKLKGYDLQSGKELWSLAGMPSFTCTTPVVGDDMLYFAGWSPGKSDGPMPGWDVMARNYDKNHDGVITREEVKGTDLESFFRAQDVNGDGKLTKEDNEAMRAMMAKGENVLVAVKPGGKGELGEDSVAWKQTRGLPYVPSALHYRGRVYTVKDGGMLSSYDAKTGKAFYQQERLDAIGGYYASPVAADGRIYVASLNGHLTVVEAGGDMPKVLHKADFGERIAATPALVGNTIYVRTPTALMAFGK